MRLVVLLCAAMYTLAAGIHVASAQVAPAAEALTEAQALARQLAADPRIRAIRSRPDAVRAAQAERARWPNPVAAFSRESVASSSDVFLVGRQELPISGRRGYLRSAGRLAVDAASAEASFDVGQLQAALRQSFATLLSAQDREAILQESVRALQELIGILRAREQAGEGSRYDRLRGERALVDLENDLAAAALARARARTELASFLGPDVAPESIVAAGTLEQAPPPSVPELIGRALQSRADYRSTELTVAQFDEERQAAGALRVPTPSLGYGLKRSGVGDVAHNGYQLSIEVAVPLFNRGQSAVALAAAEATRADLERASLRLLIEAEVRSAYVTVTMEQERATRYGQSIAEAAEPLAGIARVAYEEGELGILELLDANRQLVEARLEVLNLAVARRMAAIELDRVTGVEVKP